MHLNELFSSNIKLTVKRNDQAAFEVTSVIDSHPYFFEALYFDPGEGCFQDDDIAGWEVNFGIDTPGLAYHNKFNFTKLHRE